MENIKACIPHYNTPRLTECAIRSLWKHMPGAEVIVFDNSDKHPFVMDGVKVIDNTRGQVIDFEKWLATFPDKVPTKNHWASAKHCYTVQWLVDDVNSPFVLMDSDVLIQRSIPPYYWQTVCESDLAFVGEIRRCVVRHGVVRDRLLPYLCFLNVPVIKKAGVTYFNASRMYALTSKKPGIGYDTGTWFLEDCRNKELPFADVSIEPYILHLHHGSWKEKDASEWLNRNRELWE